MKKVALIAFGLIALVAAMVWEQTGPNLTETDYESTAPLDPNWAAIAGWPATDMARVDATPDPQRRYTAIILDDSGSMGSDMEPAKRAVIDALSAMQPQDRVAVIGLNWGVILAFTPVAEARETLPTALRPVLSDGPTPLSRAVDVARTALKSEAAQARGFGAYQMIITTDGAADDGVLLTRVIEDLARTTPIQIATIGIDIGPRHVLRRDDLGRFVDVSNISGLQEALQAAIAENTSFEAITDFQGSE